MPVQLTDDVWLVIVEEYLKNPETTFTTPPPSRWRNTISNLALANRNLCRIAQPVLFYEVKFSATGASRGLRSPSETSAFIAPKERRARALLPRQHVLRHVRRFELVGWTTVLAHIDDQRQGELGRNVDSVTLRGVQTLVSTTIDHFAGLLSQMSNLKQLGLIHSHIPCLSFSPNPLLDTLVIDGRNFQDTVRYPPVEPSITVQIRHLDFSGTSRKPSDVQSPFIGVVGYCMYHLASITISFSELADLASLVIGHQLPLRELTITTYTRYSFEDPKLETWSPHLRSIFAAVPELRQLHIDVEHRTFPEFPDGIGMLLPKLDSISCPLSVIQALIPGRPVHDIELMGWLEHETVPSALGLPLSSAALVQKLATYNLCHTTDDIFKALHHYHAFSNLTTLVMTSGFLGRIEALITPQELFHWFMVALAPFPHLRIFHLYEPYDQSDIIRTHFPNAGPSDPSDHGHPSLEQVSLYRQMTWFWVSGKGWTGEYVPWIYYQGWIVDVTVDEE